MSGDGLEVTTVVPSYGEGEGIVPTLESLWQRMRFAGLEQAPIVLNDSSPEMAPVEAAQQWAYHASATERPVVRGLVEWRAFCAEAAVDPIGALLYVAYRGLAAVTSPYWARLACTETWGPSLTTKRQATR